MKEVKEFVEKYSALLPLHKSINIPELERRAGEFLSAMATLAAWKHAFAEEKIKLISIQTAVYAEQLSKGTAKTMTENKVTAEATAEYIEAREGLERIENDINYLKAYLDIFHDAHIFYRQMCKQDSM